MSAQAAAPWRPTPLLWLSVAVHGAALVGWLVWPAAWGIWLAGLIVNHAALAAAGLLPRCTALGPNLVRLPPAAAARGEVAITIDDGPDPEVTPKVLALLAEHGAVATFFCIGERAAQAPDVLRAIVQAGHAVENHGQTHRHDASLLGLAGWRREVGEGQHTLAAITGRAPAFYRAVAGLRNPMLDPVLHVMGLRLASWTRRGFDTQSRSPERVAARLLRGLAAGDILLLHDGHAARTAEGQPLILAVLPLLLAEIKARQWRTVTLAQACNTP